MKKFHLLPVDSPIVEIECGDQMTKTDPLNSIKKNPNFPDNTTLSMTLVSTSIMYIVCILLYQHVIICILNSYQKVHVLLSIVQNYIYFFLFIAICQHSRNYQRSQCMFLHLPLECMIDDCLVRLHWLVLMLSRV